MILTPRVPSSESRCAMAGLVSVTAERSSTTGRPAKKPLDPRNHASSSSSQSAIGGSGARANAIYDRPRNGMAPRRRAVLRTVTSLTRRLLTGESAQRGSRRLSTGRAPAATEIWLIRRYSPSHGITTATQRRSLETAVGSGSPTYFSTVWRRHPDAIGRINGELVAERAERDAQNIGGAGAVAEAVLERLQGESAFDIGDGTTDHTIGKAFGRLHAFPRVLANSRHIA